MNWWAEQLPFINEPRSSGEEPCQMDLFDKPEDYEYKPFNIDPLSSGLTNGRQIILGDHWNSAEEYDPSGEVEPPPSDVERDLRFQIERTVRAYTRIYKYKQGQANKEIMAFFGKRRADMTIPELKSCLEYVQRTYRINGTGRQFAPKKEAVRFYG